MSEVLRLSSLSFAHAADPAPSLLTRSEVVLGKISRMVKDFVYRASIARGFNDASAQAAGGKVFAFGSYR